MNRKRLFISLAAAALAGGLAYWWHAAHKGGQAAAPPAAAKPSALVATQPLRRQALPLTLETFGEIATGRPDSLGFPQPGQVTALPLVAGQQVRKGELLARLATDPNAVSAYAQAANALAFARRELERQQQLEGLQLATRSQVDAAARQRDDAQAALAAQARLGGASVGAELRAPYDGVVTALAVAQGDRIAAGATVVQLGRVDRLRVLLALEPAQSALVRPGMPVAVAQVLDGASSFNGSIGAVGDAIDPKTQMVTAVALPDGALPGRMAAGTRVQASVRIGTREAWAVPRQAVLDDERGAFLFQVRAGKALRVAVARVVDAGQVVGVEGRIDAGLPLVVQGNYELVDGMAVRAQGAGAAR